METGNNIKIKCQTNLTAKEYPRLFKYKIYESFKPSTLGETRQYINYLTHESNKRD